MGRKQVQGLSRRHLLFRTPAHAALHMGERWRGDHPGHWHRSIRENLHSAVGSGRKRTLLGRDYRPGPIASKRPQSSAIIVISLLALTSTNRPAYPGILRTRRITSAQPRPERRRPRSRAHRRTQPRVRVRPLFRTPSRSRLTGADLASGLFVPNPRENGGAPARRLKHRGTCSESAEDAGKAVETREGAAGVGGDRRAQECRSRSF